MEWFAASGGGGDVVTDTRLAGADFVRALACLMVVAHHVAQRVAPSALPPAAMWAAPAITMGAFGVAAFFVLSGYLLSRPFWLALDAGERMPSLRTYAIRRAARILPGFWLALTVTFLLSFTVLRFPFDGILLLRYLSGVFLVSGGHWLTWFPVEFNGPLWSIGAEIISYAALPLCLMLLFGLRVRGWPARLVWLVIITAVVGLQFLALRTLQPDAFQRGWEYGTVGGAKLWWPNYSPFGFFAIFAIQAGSTSWRWPAPHSVQAPWSGYIPSRTALVSPTSPTASRPSPSASHSSSSACPPPSRSTASPNSRLSRGSPVSRSGSMSGTICSWRSCASSGNRATSIGA